MTGSVPRIWKTGEGRRFVRTFTLDVEDHLAGRYGRELALPFGRFAGFVVLASLFVGFLFAHSYWKAGNLPMVGLIVIGAFFAGYLIAKLTYRFFNGLFHGFLRGFLEKREAIGIPFEMTIDKQGVAVLIREQTWFSPWESFVGIEEDDERYYFWTSEMQAHVLPKRLFTQAERLDLDEALLEWSGAKPISPPVRAGRQHLSFSRPAEAP